MSNLLTVDSLQICFDTHNGRLAAVDEVSFSVDEGKTVCIVGESGSGKSVTSLGIMKLLQSPPAHYTGGSILFYGENLLEKTENEMRGIRGSQISMIFQEPITSLNPVLTVGFQIMESVQAHRKNCNQAIIKNESIKLLELVGITDPEKRFYEYPHQMSGGMCQRVMIAMALACKPRLLIADEPTTALDVTIQAQILDLMKKLKQQTGTAILFITHDLGVVAEMADEIIVMYAGNIMEKGTSHDIFLHPRHPYTRGLLNCIPKINKRENKLLTIEGTVPKLGCYPKGCHFSTRCNRCQAICAIEKPVMHNEKGHSWACHFPIEE